MKKAINNDRPIFYLNDNKTMELKAGGILFYKWNNEKTNFDLLLIKSKNRYEDFGGCTDKYDSNILETIARETDEESNGIFKKHTIIDKIKNADYVYIEHSKYILYIVELIDYYNPKIFGTKEYHDKFYRKVKWILYDEFINPDFIKKLNYRLRSSKIFSYLKNIKDKSFK